MAIMLLPIVLLIEFFLRFAFVVSLCLFLVWRLCFEEENTILCMYVIYETIFYLISALTLLQVPRKFTSKVVGKMCYEDFVYFMLSEEDKSSEPALEYWYVISLFLCLRWSMKKELFHTRKTQWFLDELKFTTILKELIKISG